MSDVHLILHGAVAEVRLDNPTKMNAFSVQMLRQLAAHLKAIDQDPDIQPC